MASSRYLRHQHPCLLTFENHLKLNYIFPPLLIPVTQRQGNMERVIETLKKRKRLGEWKAQALPEL
jgi:hypothetical protein